MSVLIKGMEMPKNCGDCPIGDALCCSLMPKVPASWKEYTIAVRTNRRHSDCPLVPVPPHGRLIDADELSRAALENFFFNFVPRWMVKDAPTVIPADKNGET